jgi:hypothetical protein
VALGGVSNPEIGLGMRRAGDAPGRFWSFVEIIGSGAGSYLLRFARERIERLGTQQIAKG